MKIQVLRYALGGKSKDPEAREINCDDKRDLLQAKNENPPAVMVLSHEDLARLCEIDGDLLLDRKTKDARKSLADYLLRQDPAHIPFVRTSYQVPRRVTNGIRKFLDRAKESGEDNLYLVSIEADVFGRLWNASANERVTKPVRAAVTSGACYPSTGGGQDDEQLTSETLIKLMDERPVPNALDQAFVGGSRERKLLLQLVLHATEVRCPVLIVGDSGSGKEVIATQIHAVSNSTGPLVTVNCGAISAELLESELFGYMKDAFTGATRDKKGLWEEAKGGTLFLDEIGDLRMDHQVKILRSLQEGKIRRVGGTREIDVDARVIAATNRDLLSMVQAETFREDLYYRLCGFFIRTSPLRDRIADIPPLASFFWSKIDKATHALPKPILDELTAYSWPGNARELKNALNRLYAHFPDKARKGQLGVEHLRAALLLGGQRPTTNAANDRSRQPSILPTEYLRFLRKVGQIMDAQRIAVLPLTDGKNMDAERTMNLQAALAFGAEELGLLSDNYDPLFDSHIYDSVWALQGKMRLFIKRLERTPWDVHNLWKTGFADAFNGAISEIQEETERVLERIA